MSWQDFAACQYVDPELFFPDKGGDPQDAIALCFQCPVRRECLEAALEHESRPGEVPHGVWGGLTGRERAVRLGQRSWLPCPDCGSPTPKNDKGMAARCALCRHERRTEARAA